jgi:hypothetical protein
VNNGQITITKTSGTESVRYSILLTDKSVSVVTEIQTNLEGPQSQLYWIQPFSKRFKSTQDTEDKIQPIIKHT